jgi:tetratricopeptide (TPR) repeat protein
MILRLSTSAERLVILIAAILIAALMCFFGIRSAWASHAAGLGTVVGIQRATRLEPGNAEYWYLLGRYWQFNLEGPDSQKAIDAYRNALSFDPHSAETYIDLATAYEGIDDIPDARDNFLKAKKAYPLSAGVSWRVGNFFLRQGEMDEAFTQIRESVVADPARGAEAFSRCLRVEPNLKTVLDRAIPEEPVVYLDIIRDLSEEGRATESLIVWDRLVAMNSSIPLTEIYPIINLLRAKRDFAEASRVWKQGVAMAGLDHLGDPPASLVWDGGFESGLRNFGYSWFYEQKIRTVQVGLDQKERHAGQQSLRLAFDGTSDVTFDDVCHAVTVLPLTSYKFSAWVQTRDLTTDQGLRFRLQSSGHNSTPEFTPEIHGTHEWTEITVPWSSDADANEAQICIARLPSDQKDNRIRGSAWVDDVSLIPQLALPLGKADRATGPTAP